MVITPVRERNIPQPENILVTFPDQVSVAGNMPNFQHSDDTQFAIFTFVYYVICNFQ